MSMNEKQSLVNELTLTIAGEFNVDIKKLKSTVASILTQYHITFNEEPADCEDDSAVLLNKFISAKKATGMKDRTLTQYKVAIKLLEDTVHKKFNEVEDTDIKNFLMLYRDSGVSSVTVRNKFLLITSVYNHLYKRHYINYNPIAFVETPKAEVIYRKSLASSELEKVKAAIETLPRKESLRNMAIVYFFVSTGCRVSELIRISIKDLDFASKTVKVLGKGNKERLLVLTDSAMYRLNMYLKVRNYTAPEAPLFSSIRSPEHRLTKDGVENIIHKIRKAADLPNITCHTFRRYYATELRKRNVPIQMIATSLGHANLNTINRYSLYSQEEMTDTIRAAM